jgi:hypothetical protein
MAEIYLRHPIHGTKIATMELEAEADMQNGWMEYDPGAPDASDEEEETLPEPAVAVNVLATAPRRRTRTRATPDE